MEGKRVILFLWLISLVSAVKLCSVTDNALGVGIDNYKMNIDCVNAVRAQVNDELHASLVYMQMAAHFGRNRFARKGFEKFFEESSKEEREHGQKLIDYLNSRGAFFAGFNISMPKTATWDSGLQAFEDALSLENTVNNKLYDLLEKCSTPCEDHHLHNYIEEEFLKEQVRSIDQLKRYIAILKQMKNDATSEYLFDLQLQDKKPFL